MKENIEIGSKKENNNSMGVDCGYVHENLVKLGFKYLKETELGEYYLEGNAESIHCDYWFYQIASNTYEIEIKVMDGEERRTVFNGSICSVSELYLILKAIGVFINYR